LRLTAGGGGAAGAAACPARAAGAAGLAPPAPLAISGGDEVLLPDRRNPRLGHVHEDRGAGGLRLALGLHARLARKAVALAPVAGGAAGHDVVPGRVAALRAGDHVV